MRFVDYMKLSSDTDESIFRSLKIDIINVDKYGSLIDQLSEKHRYIKDAVNIVNDINKQFKRYYCGSKYKYGFCMEGSKSIDGIVLNKKQRDALYQKYYNANDQFEQLKKQFENDISYDKYLT